MRNPCQWSASNIRLCDLKSNNNCVNGLNAVVPKTNRNYGKRAFAVAGPTAWNSLPVQIRRANTVKKFKSALKTHLFSIHYPTAE